MTAMTKQLSRPVRWSAGLLLVVWTLGVWACAAHCAGLLQPAAGAHTASCCQQSGAAAADLPAKAATPPVSEAGGQCDGIRCHGDVAILPAAESASLNWETLFGWLPVTPTESQLRPATPGLLRAAFYAPPEVRPPLPAAWPPHWGLAPPASPA